MIDGKQITTFKLQFSELKGGANDLQCICILPTKNENVLSIIMDGMYGELTCNIPDEQAKEILALRR
jgi:hypothetical protein